MQDFEKIFDLTNHAKALKYVLQLNSKVWIYTQMDNELRQVSYIFSFELPEHKQDISYFKNHILSYLASIDMHFDKVILTDRRLTLTLQKEELFKFVSYVNRLATKQDNNIILDK